MNGEKLSFQVSAMLVMDCFINTVVFISRQRALKEEVRSISYWPFLHMWSYSIIFEHLIKTSSLRCLTLPTFTYSNCSFLIT